MQQKAAAKVIGRVSIGFNTGGFRATESGNHLDPDPKPEPNPKTFQKRMRQGRTLAHPGNRKGSNPRRKGLGDVDGSDSSMTWTVKCPQASNSTMSPAQVTPKDKQGLGAMLSITSVPMREGEDNDSSEGVNSPRTIEILPKPQTIALPNGGVNPTSADPNLQCRMAKHDTVRGKSNLGGSTPPRMMNPKEAKSTMDPDRIKVRGILADKRSAHTIGKAKANFAMAAAMPAYVVFENATGGCLDTVSAGLAGLRHAGGTEDISTPLGLVKATAFEDVTGSQCWGDTYDWRTWAPRVIELEPTIHIFKAGQPCTIHAALGDQKGSEGDKGGDLSLVQIEEILYLKPIMVRLEMVEGALDSPLSNPGQDIRQILNSLSDEYRMDASLLNVWEHGDPTRRRRIFIIGMRRDMIDSSITFPWPEPIFNAEMYPIARDIAVPDIEVPDDYWRYDPVTQKDKVVLKPKAGKIQKVGTCHQTVGDNYRGGLSIEPKNVSGWDGIFNTLLPTNGGSRRPELDWKPGTPIKRTRMTVTMEHLRGASLDEPSYLEWITRIFDRTGLNMSRDQFIRDAVNMGVPICTSLAIDQAMVDTLIQAGVKPTIPDTASHQFVVIDPKVDSNASWKPRIPKPHKWDGRAWRCEAGSTLDHDSFQPSPVSLNAFTTVGFAMIAHDRESRLAAGIGDSGASDHLMDAAINPCLRDPRPSTSRYALAEEGQFMMGDKVGELDVTCLNLDNQPDCPMWQDHEITVTTVVGMGPQSLWSLESEYRDHGMNIAMEHGYTPNAFTGMWRPEGTPHGPAKRLPMVYGWRGRGGWTVPYIIKRPDTCESQHQAVLRAVLQEHGQAKRSTTSTTTHPVLNAFACQVLNSYFWADCSAVRAHIVRVEGERDIRPAFTYGGMKRHKATSWHERHSQHAHMGEPGEKCYICDMFKGIASAKPKHTYGKPREVRVGHTWHMDMITFRHRSEEGCKHAIILTDEACDFRQILPVFWKSDSTYELKVWITALRSHPAFANHTAYAMVSVIVTDNESVWSAECREFHDMLHSLGECRWIPLQTKTTARDVIPEIVYGAPEDHARDNARAEGANKIIEAGICSLLFERNLPPSWWQRAAGDIMFLCNRYPTIRGDAATPPDGDRAPPLELLFMGYYSRHQIYRELDSYISVGSLGLCRVPSSKGSDIEPRVRWGVAIGHRGKVTNWMCPYVHSRFKSRTFHAYTLRTGLNYSQFLGLGDIASNAQSKMMPGDQDEEMGRDRWIITLPEVKHATLDLPQPVKELIVAMNSNENMVSIRARAVEKSKDLCEFFPKLKRVKAKNEQEGDDLEPLDEDQDCDTADRPRIEVQKADGTRLTVASPEECVNLRNNDLPLTESNHIDGSVEGNCEQGSNPLDQGQTLDNGGPSNPRSKKRPKRKQADRCPIITRSHQNELGRIRGGPPTGAPTRPGGKLPPAPPADDTGNIPTKSGDNRKRSRTVRFESATLEGFDEAVVDMESQAEALTSEFTYHDRKAKELEDDAARRHRGKDVTTDGGTTWGKVCKTIHSRMNTLPHEQHNLYRLWLLTKPERDGEKPLYVEDLPKEICNGRHPLKGDLHLPFPSGPHWEHLLEDKAFRTLHGERIDTEELEEEKAFMAQADLEREKVRHTSAVKGLALAMAANKITGDEVDALFALSARLHNHDGHSPPMDLNAFKSTRLSGRTRVTGTGHNPDPKTVIEALMGEEGEEWARSLHKEMTGLNKQEVFSHGWTRNMLIKAGITSRPVPCRTAMVHKFTDGELSQLKSRICLAGHKGNVTKGIHYGEVFSPSPNQHTERILQAMRVIYHLFNLAWDIKQAYTWAPLPPGQRIAVIYPEGFQRPPVVNPKTGEAEEVFMVLEKNLYGMPSAGRGWSKHRDKFILRRFNPGSGEDDDGTWTCQRCRMDPCLFVIDKKVDPNSREKERDARHGTSADHASLNLSHNIERSYVLIHTDDCDGYGSSPDVLHEIFEIMDNEWQAVIIDSSYVLGVKRTVVTDDPTGWYVTLTMSSYIEDMCELYAEDLSHKYGPKWKDRGKRAPCTEGHVLTKADEPQEGEVARNLVRGYQRLVGSLLWVVRHVLPDALFACSQLCKLMSCPTDKAWDAAIHLAMYCYTKKDRGIRFTETDSAPIAYVDASANDDRFDGKCQYGFNIQWAGPAISKSSKLSHVGMNSTYNEYQALTHCIKHLAWMRQLMIELRLGHACSKPIEILADNKQANNLCHEDVVTSGNMYFRTLYHYNKEEVEAGNVKVVYIPTALNCSDINTKGLGPVKHEYFERGVTGFNPNTYECRNGKWDPDYGQ